MNKSAAPMVCENCHVRRLNPVTDKHHRWCKKCREKEFLKLQGKAAPDALRLRRVMPYGDYHAWLALYRAVVIGRTYKQLYVTKTTVYEKTAFRVGRA